MTPAFWMNLQMDYDLELAQDKLGDKLMLEIPEIEDTNRE